VKRIRAWRDCRSIAGFALGAHRQPVLLFTFQEVSVFHLSARAGALVAGVVVPAAILVSLLGGASAPIHAASNASPTATVAATPSASATVSPTPSVSPAPSAIATTVASTATGGGGDLPPDPTLLADENSLLSAPLPNLLGDVPLSALPPITGSVAGLEARALSLTGRVLSSNLSGADKSALLARLSSIGVQLGDAVASEDRVSALRDDENALLRTQVDSQVGIDRLVAQVQVTLDALRAAVEANVTSDVVASVGSISITVNGSAETISATLGARTDRLLVNVIADLDVLHVATLHATANVDTTRLNVTLNALVRRLKLDLTLLLTNLRVSVHADVSAAVAAEASLTLSLSAEVDGLKADLAADTQTKLAGLDGILRPLIGSINGTLAGAASDLAAIARHVPAQ